MDKLGHLFNEGFQYYLLYQGAKNNGENEHLALTKAIQFGIDTEKTYFGRWASGIYSNADLASNYSGLHFYLNLFSPLNLNGITYPAILSTDEWGDYHINHVPQNTPENLLKRFISEHMNEALNPSSLEYLQYIVVKESVLTRCSSWQKKYPEKAY